MIRVFTVVLEPLIQGKEDCRGHGIPGSREAGVVFLLNHGLDCRRVAAVIDVGGD